MSIIGNNPDSHPEPEAPKKDLTEVEIPKPVIVAQEEPESIAGLIQEPENITRTQPPEGAIIDPEINVLEPEVAQV